MEPFGSGESLSIQYPAQAGRVPAVAAGNDAFDEVFWGLAGPTAKTSTSLGARPGLTASAAPQWATSKPNDDRKDSADLPLEPGQEGNAVKAVNRQTIAAEDHPQSKAVPTQWLASYRVDTGQFASAAEASKSAVDIVDQQDTPPGTSEPNAFHKAETKAGIALGQEAALLDGLPDLGTIMASMTPQQTIGATASVSPDTGIGHGPITDLDILGAEGMPAWRTAPSMARSAVATQHSAGPGSEERDATDQAAGPVQANSAIGGQDALAGQSMTAPARGAELAVMAQPAVVPAKLREGTATTPVEASLPQSSSEQRPEPHFGNMGSTRKAQLDLDSASGAADRLQQAEPHIAEADGPRHRPGSNSKTSEAALAQQSEAPGKALNENPEVSFGNKAVSEFAPASGRSLHTANSASFDAESNAGLTVEPRVESGESSPAASPEASKRRDVSGVGNPPATEPRFSNLAATVSPALDTAPIANGAVEPAPHAALSVLPRDVEITAVSEFGGKSALEDTVSDPADGSTGLSSITVPADHTQMGTTKAAALAAHEAAQSVSRQIASTLMLQHDRPVELTLSPEELGKVRLTLTSAENGITVSIIAERPETLDLMRRNIDTLARDFREMGYENTSFSFGQQAQQQRSEASPYVARDSGGMTPPAPISTLQEPIRLSLNRSTGLDLRF